MRVNVSAVKSFQRNPRRWWYEYSLKRIPKTRTVALDVGTAVHRVLADHFLGREMPTALNAGRAYVYDMRQTMLTHAQFEAAEDLVKEWEGLVPLLEAWTSKYEVQTVKVEEELWKQLPGSEHVLYGTPDRVVRWNGAFWHVQNRTLSGSTPIAPYLRAASLNLHELAYAWLIREHGMIPYGGTLFNIIRKLKLMGAKGKPLHAPEECFVQEFIPLTEDHINAAIAEITRTARAMSDYIAHPPASICTEACVLGRYGNSLCPYFDVCMGEASLEDESLFVNRDETPPPLSGEILATREEP